MKLWLLAAQNFLQKSSSQVEHLFLVSQRGTISSYAEAWESRIPEERFEFNEDVERDWSEMQIPYGGREQISASISPEVRRAV